MALTEKLTAIADAIRAKTGGSEKLTLSEMPVAIEGIQGGGGSEDLQATIDGIMDQTVESVESFVENVASMALYNCMNLKSAVFPNATRIGSMAFYGCRNMVTAHFPMVKQTEPSAFQDCIKVEKFDFHQIEQIASATFCSCSSLKAFIMRTPVVCTLGSDNAFLASAVERGVCCIYVPSALIEQYKVAENWSKFATQFRAIEDYPDICGTK